MQRGAIQQINETYYIPNNVCDPKGFWKAPRLKSVLTLDGLAFRVMDCTTKAGILAIELEAVKR